MKKVTLKIEKKEYDINLKDEIALEIEKIIENDFNIQDGISTKELLTAYIKNSIDKNHLKNDLKTLHEKINALNP